MFDARYSGYVRVGGLIAVISMLAAAPSWAGPQVYRGTISTGAQYDLYNIPLLAGQGVIGRLVCEELSPAQRPLDPVLSVYFPGVDPSDTVNASIYNDDGFGGDDNPAEGVDCNAFDSSQVIFTAPVTGNYIFRADGFGSATGPYSLTILPRAIVTGVDAGGGPHVLMHAGVGATPNAVTRSFLAYAGSMAGGVRVAVGDVSGDGTPDIVTAPGPGAAPTIRVFDGVFGAELRSFLAYDASFTGGVYVAVGDVNGDGRADIVTAPGAGGGPHVRVFDAVTGASLHSFLAYTPGFAGGVRVAAGDVNGDGKADIVTAPGPGGGPHVRVFNGVTGAELSAFFAFSPAFTGGVFVAAGDVNADRRADIIVAADAGGGPHVQAFSGADGTLLLSFLAYGAAFSGGVRVAAADVNGDGRADIITGPGPGGGPHVQVFSGLNAAVLQSYLAYDPSFTGGIFVAGSGR